MELTRLLLLNDQSAKNGTRHTGVPHCAHCPSLSGLSDSIEPAPSCIFQLLKVRIVNSKMIRFSKVEQCSYRSIKCYLFI